MMLSMLAYGGLFAFISGSSFVLQNIYGLAPLGFAFSFAFVVVGYIAGTFLAAAFGGQARPRRHDSDRRLVPRARRQLMILLVAFGVTSSSAIVGPMALYGAGVGLTMPQAMASALMPFPDRAGTASSLLGICQMSFAALLGIALGQHLDGSALPLPIAVAATGVIALACMFLLTGRARDAGLRVATFSGKARTASSRTFFGPSVPFGGTRPHHSVAHPSRHERRIPARGWSVGIR